MIVSFYNAVFGISCYYAVVSFLLRYPAGLNHASDPFAFALLVTAALLFSIAGRFPHAERVLRVTAALLPAAAFLWNHTLPGILAFTLPWGYLLYLAYRKPRSLSHYYFRESFGHLLWIFPFLALLILFRTEQGIAALRESAPYIIIFLTSGVSLLQTLRHRSESDDQKRLAKYQGGQTIGFFLLCMLLTVGGLLELLEDIVLKKLLIPAGLFLGSELLQFMQFARELLWKLFRNREGTANRTREDYAEYVEKLMERQEPIEQMKVSPDPPLIDRGEVNYTVVALLIAAAVAVVLFFVFRNSTKKRVRGNAIFDERETLPEEKKAKKRKKRRTADPEEAVRMYYRKFMQKAAGQTHKVKRQDTTEEIREKYEQGREADMERIAPATAELTEIYRVARYRGKETTKASAGRMKILLDYLKKV